jgi:hypothetical protein
LNLLAAVAVLGNHDYKGDPSLEVAMHAAIPHWVMPERYYNLSFAQDGVSLDFFFIDTSPMVPRYRNESKWQLGCAGSLLPLQRCHDALFAVPAQMNSLNSGMARTKTGEFAARMSRNRFGGSTDRKSTRLNSSHWIT